MEITVTPEQEDLRRMTADLFGGLSQRSEWGQGDLDAGPLAECWTALADLDLLAAGIPVEHGGVGGGVAETNVVCEELGRAALPVPYDVAVPVAAVALAHHGNEEQRAELLPDALTGRTVLSAAVPIPDPATLPHLTGSTGRLRLSGETRHVPFLDRASTVVVPAVDARSDADLSVVLLLIDPAAPGVQRRFVRATDFSSEGHLSFTDLPLRDDRILACGDEHFHRLRARALSASCAVQLGLCAAAIQLAVNHVGSRKQFGRPLAAFQAVTQRLADAYIDLRTMTVATARLAHLLDHDSDEVLVPASVAKVLCSTGARRIMRSAVHLHGGIGVDVTYPLARYVVMSKRHELWLGGSEAHLEILASSLSTEDGLDRALST